MLKPYKAIAMIHSLGSEHEALIVRFEDNNHCRAVFGNKLCSAVYNPYTGMFYVDDIYTLLRPDTQSYKEMFNLAAATSAPTELKELNISEQLLWN